MGDYAEDSDDDLFGNFDDVGEDESGFGAARTVRAAKKGIVFVVECSEAMLKMDSHRAVEGDEESDDGMDDSAAADGTKRAFNSCALQRAMEVIFLAMRKRVITDASTTNLVGLVLYGTKESKNENGFDNVVEYHSFGGIDVERIYDVKAIGEAPRDHMAKFGGPAPPPSEGDSALDRALWLCNFLFSGAKLKPYDEQKVWLFTNDDNPHRGSADLKAKLTKRLEDLFQAGQTVDVWPLVARGAFDENRFYKDAINKLEGNAMETDDPLDPGIREPGQIFYTDGIDVESLRNFVRKKDAAKRRLAPLTLDMGNGVQIGLDMYPLLMRAVMPAAQKLDAITQSVVRVNTQYICYDTMTTLTPDQIEFFFEYGPSSRVFVRPEEVRLLKRFGEAATIQVLGFKPSSCLKPWHALRSPYFVVPSEARFKGSTTCFNALLKSMLDKDLIMIAAATFRASEPCKLLALLPRRERLLDDAADGDGAADDDDDDDPLLERVDEQGMDVIVLPWANDIRKLKLGPDLDLEAAMQGEADGEDDLGQLPTKATPEVVELASSVAAKMMLRADETTGRYTTAENPNLQKHFAALESVALRGAGHSDAQMEWDASQDTTLPLQLSQSRLRLVEAFKSAYGGIEPPEDLVQLEKLRKKAAASSRSTSAAAKAPAAKRKRGAPAVKAEPSDIDWKQMAKDGKLSKMTVAQLKEVCRENDLAVTGKKADLIARLEEILDSGA